MPNLDEIGKKVFEEETPLATKGALTFQRDPTSSVQSAESDGLLLATSQGLDLSALPAPWCFFPKNQPEVLIELKMRGDKTNPHAVHRALLQREAWEFAQRDKAQRARETYDHEIPIWFVSAHFPKWLEKKTSFEELAVGCYRSKTLFYDLYWIVSSELPKEEALIPFLITRDTGPLEDFFTWVAKVRTPEWVMSLLKVFHMSQHFIEEVMSLAPTTDDPKLLAQRAFIAKRLIAQDPNLKAEIEREAARKAKQEGTTEGETRILKHQLEFKLGRTLSTEEEVVFHDELRLKGTEQVSGLLIAADTKALQAWLHPPPPKPSPKKTKIKK